MTADQARVLLSRLELAFEDEYTDEARDEAVSLLMSYDAALIKAAYEHLVQSAKRLPPPALIVQAFERVADQDRPSRDALRSAPQPPQDASYYRDLDAYLAFEPVMYHRDLYWGYVDAMREYREGRRTKDEMQRLRQMLIEQARRRGIPPRRTLQAHPQAHDDPVPDPW